MNCSDQASQLREMVRRDRDCRTIAVTSGKGGVGKSNVSLNLSLLLSAMGARVALVDADLGLANLDILLDVKIQHTLAHVIAGRRTVSEIIVELATGVQFVPGASGLAKAANLTDFTRYNLLGGLEKLEEDNDFVIVDTGAGIGPGVLQFAASADQVITVTTPEPTAMTDAYAVIKILSQRSYPGQLSLLVNQAEKRQQARETYTRISTVARQFLAQRVYDAGYVLADPRVGEAVLHREPFVLAYPRCPASRCMAALANKLSADGALVPKREGFFRRVVNWFA